MPAATTAPRPVCTIAPAKVNLSLEVLGRRPDGYHDLATIFHAIDLHDALAVTPRPDGRLTLEVTGRPVPGAPETNLVLRAAELLRVRFGVSLGADLRLHKRIPVAAGLGGGSADAAAALVALDAAWGLGLTAEARLELAAALGADVPFCLLGGAALGERRGDRLTPLPPLRATWLVLLPGSAHVPDKTRRLFGALSPADWSDGGRTHALADALQSGTPIRQLGPNAFEAPARRLLPGVDAALTAFDQVAGAGLAGLSGSGPSVFAPVGSAGEAERLVAALGALGYNALAVRPIATGARLVDAAAATEFARAKE